MNTSPDAEIAELVGGGTEASETLSRPLLTLAKKGKLKPGTTPWFSLGVVAPSEFALDGDAW